MVSSDNASNQVDIGTSILGINEMVGHFWNDKMDQSGTTILTGNDLGNKPTKRNKQSEISWNWFCWIFLGSVLTIHHNAKQRGQWHLQVGHFGSHCITHLKVLWLLAVFGCRDWANNRCQQTCIKDVSKMWSSCAVNTEFLRVYRLEVLKHSKYGLKAAM